MRQLHYKFYSCYWKFLRLFLCAAGAGVVIDVFFGFVFSFVMLVADEFFTAGDIVFGVFRSAYPFVTCSFAVPIVVGAMGVSRRTFIGAIAVCLTAFITFYAENLTTYGTYTWYYVSVPVGFVDCLIPCFFHKHFSFCIMCSPVMGVRSGCGFFFPCCGFLLLG